MLKAEFLARLREKLSGLPADDLEERLGFYGEMIDDRVEEGLSEHEAVAAVGTVDEVADQILAETPLGKLVKERIKPKRRLSTGEIALIAVGSPVWAPLLIALLAIIFSAFAALWAVWLSLWAVVASLGAMLFSEGSAAFTILLEGGVETGLFHLGCAFLAVGLAVFAFFGCLAAGRGLLRLTAITVLWLKRGLVRKERT